MFVVSIQFKLSNHPPSIMIHTSFQVSDISWKKHELSCCSHVFYVTQKPFVDSVRTSTPWRSYLLQQEPHVSSSRSCKRSHAWNSEESFQDAPVGTATLQISLRQWQATSLFSYASLYGVKSLATQELTLYQQTLYRHAKMWIALLCKAVLGHAICSRDSVSMSCEVLLDCATLSSATAMSSDDCFLK